MTTTKGEKGQATRQHVVSVATRLFTKAGYEATSIEDVLNAAEMSRGALYYHFPGKDKLFEAVLEELEIRIAETIRAASRSHTDPVAGLQAGCEAFLKLATEPSVRQIVLIDAPVAIGWQKWREIDARHGFGLMKGAIQSAAAAGRIRSELVEPFAHMLLAALMEMALVVARAENPKSALRTGRAAIGELITKLFPKTA